MSSAKDTVISTTELLEHILERPPMRALLVTAPLVSKTWQAITLTSAFQRALFLQPDPASSQSAPVKNPLLEEVFAPFFRRDSDLNPQNRFTWSDAKAIKAMPWSKAPDAFRRREASWRRMLVQQPPAQTMLVTEKCEGQLGDEERRAVLRDLELRMGLLYNITLPFIDRVASSFRIHWHDNIDNQTPTQDLTLDVNYVQQCVIGLRGSLTNSSVLKGPRRSRLILGNGKTWATTICERTIYNPHGSPFL
ncbi:hypothetical protein B0H19DRAFT_1110560 [Mycena capillaripes]|nr:hypothetical protein B0H19DRAFT_1110560 [Mycena capillaripes]